MKKILALLLFCAVPLVFAEDINCLDCHGKDGDLPIHVDKFKNSVHSDLACTDCHVGADKVKKGEVFEEVHPDNLEGKTPQCTECHEEKVKGLAKSVHSDLSCSDCHGTIHDLTDDALLSQNKFKIHEVCSDCHDEVVEEYVNSVHGKGLIEKKNQDSPSCLDCHGDIHSVLPKDNENSPVFRGNVPQTCDKCHDNEEIMKRNGLRTKQSESYKEDFHGKMIALGLLKAATCADCHTAHNILKSSNPKSTVNKKNVPKTCGKCHKGANENYAKGNFHTSHKYKEDKWQWIYGLFFFFLTTGTMVALIIHMALDANARLREKREKKKENKE